MPVCSEVSPTVFRGIFSQVNLTRIVSYCPDTHTHTHHAALLPGHMLHPASGGGENRGFRQVRNICPLVPAI